MQNNSLLFGIIGFLLGGLLVSVAATTFDKPTDKTSAALGTNLSMAEMVESLKSKNGDDYDKAFISEMIAHHQSAVDMAKLSADRAKHDEIKTLSDNIIAAQEKEITEMKRWQAMWNYTVPSTMNDMGH
jgi:uncharacterized protein (DUF305 family)